MRRLLGPWVTVFLRLIVGGLFLYAGILKLADSQALADSISSFQILPSGFINLLALVLPVLEILLGLGLLSGYRLRACSFGVCALLGIFLIALGQAAMRGLSVDCGCFGSGGTNSSFSLLIALFRNLLLLAGSFVLLRQTAKVRDKQDFA